MLPPGVSYPQACARESSIYPDDPTFFQQFAYVSEEKATPSTSKFTPELPHTEIIHKRDEAAKQFLEEGGQSTFHCPSTEEFEPSPHEVPKQPIN